MSDGHLSFNISKAMRLHLRYRLQYAANWRSSANWYTQTKAEIRNTIFRGLSDPNSKIRSSCVRYCLSQAFWIITEIASGSYLITNCKLWLSWRIPRSSYVFDKSAFLVLVRCRTWFHAGFQWDHQIRPHRSTDSTDFARITACSTNQPWFNTGMTILIH